MSSGHVECGGIGDRSPADEALTDVHGGLAVDEPLALEQRDDLVGRPHGDHSARIERGECGAGNRRVDGTGDRDLPRRAEPEVEAAEHPREPPGSAAKGGLDQAENGHCSAFELVVTPDPAEAQKHPREHRVAGGNRRVLKVAGARHALVGVCRREEETAALLVGEELDREQREPVSLEEPADLAGRDMQLEQPICDIRVVVEVPAATCPFVTRERRSLPFSEAARAGNRPRRGQPRASLRVRGGTRPQR